MGKATIIEAQNSSTVYEQGKQSGILGKLKGIFADYKNGTRNSDRLYTEELWDNRVFGSEDVMEALETKTLFGELDHPEGDRCETLAQNAAISIVKLEKRPEEGVIYGEAEILDTPTGRIVKALADSGAKLGISSRGLGEEVFVEGKNIIDPETYDFITFDVVVTPANTKARVSLTESKQINKLTESLNKEVNECETENQLNQLKTVLKNVNTSNKTELLNIVESKLNNINKVSTLNTTKLDEANKSLAIKILNKKLTECTNDLNEILNASEQLSTENVKLSESNNFLTSSRDTIKGRLKESISNVNNVQKQLKEAQETINTLNTKLEESNNKLDEIDNLNKENLFRVRQINDKKVENIELQYKETIAKLEESNKEITQKYTNLQESNKKMAETLNNNRKVILEGKQENKQLKEQIKILESKQLESSKKLTESKLQESNKIKQLESKIKQLELNNRKMEEAQDRFSKLSFNPLGTVSAVAENFRNEEMNSEEIDLFNALTGR